MKRFLEKRVGLAVFPSPPTLWQQLLGYGSRDGMTLRMLGPVLRQDVETAARLLQESEVGIRSGALWMGPPLEIEYLERGTCSLSAGSPEARRGARVENRNL